MDPYVLDIILCGVKLDFIPPPTFNYSHIRTHFSTDQELAIKQELTIFLQKKVICPTTLSPTSYVSPIFTTEKKGGSNRLILQKKVICPTTLSPTSYVSPIFTTEKKGLYALPRYPQLLMCPLSSPQRRRVAPIG